MTLGLCGGGDKDAFRDRPFWLRASAPPGRCGLHRFTAATSTATHRPSWWWPSLQNTRRFRVSGGWRTNTHSQPNSIPYGQPSLWRLVVTKGERSSYSKTLAVSL